MIVIRQLYDIDQVQAGNACIVYDKNQLEERIGVRQYNFTFVIQILQSAATYPFLKFIDSCLHLRQHPMQAAAASWKRFLTLLLLVS